MRVCVLIQLALICRGGLGLHEDEHGCMRLVLRYESQATAPCFCIPDAAGEAAGMECRGVAGAALLSGQA